MTDGAMQSCSLTLDKCLDHAAKWHPRAEVVTAGSGGAIERIGYAALRERATRLSTVLAGLGVRPGERVATLAWNSQAHLEAWYAIMGMGAACHTLNPRLTAERSAAMLARSAASVLIVSADLAPLAAELAARTPSLRRVLIIDGQADAWPEPGGAVTVAALEALLADTREPLPWGGFEETAACGLCFTSGTTGDPKGVTSTHRASYLQTLQMLQADAIGLGAADTILAAVPMFHANAWGLPFAAPAVGARLVLPGRQLDGASLAALIAGQGVTVAAGVPTVWLGLVEHLGTHGGELPSLRRIMVGGAPLSAALMARLEKRLGVIVQTSWGMTELSPLGTMMSANDENRTAAVSGRPSVGVDLLLTDAEGHALPEQRGVEGHLRVRGAAVVERYFGHATPATDAAGWFETGDLARLDARGHPPLTRRAHDSRTSESASRSHAK